MLERYIDGFTARLEYLKEKVENDTGFSYFAEDKVSSLLKEEIRLKLFMESPDLDPEDLRELNSLINQTKQFLEDVKDLIELERKKHAQNLNS